MEPNTGTDHLSVRCVMSKTRKNLTSLSPVLKPYNSEKRGWMVDLTQRMLCQRGASEEKVAKET